MFLVYGDLDSNSPLYKGYFAILAGDGILIGRSSAYFPTALIHEFGDAIDSTLAFPECNSSEPR